MERMEDLNLLDILLLKVFLVMQYLQILTIIIVQVLGQDIPIQQLKMVEIAVLN
jgi:hypothetical protein